MSFDSASRLPECYSDLAVFDVSLNPENEQAPFFHLILRRQILGQLFLNTSMRLLI